MAGGWGAEAFGTRGGWMEKRARLLNAGEAGPGPVACWLSRDQRARDNWALLSAQKLALARRVPLLAVFCLVPRFLGATLRQYAFMLAGLAETAQDLTDLGIPFHLLQGDPGVEIPRFVREHDIGTLITDFDPLRIKRGWKAAVAGALSIPLMEVDAHNIVPCWLASPKAEWSAGTFRPKIRRALPEFLTDFPQLRPHPYAAPSRVPPFEAASLLAGLPLDTNVRPVTWLAPGPRPAMEKLFDFIEKKLPDYDRLRNDPNQPGQSDLSPYLHFGQLAPQRVAWEVLKSPAPDRAKDAFLEELIVRRELSDNFCYYTPHYDQVEGFPEWARKTLEAHRKDEREYLYTLEELDGARTHDPLWNAAQREMVRRGKMHGYLRMYWAKKILEWTPSPEEALAAAIYLNDRYELDGRDPNGYTGIAWSIGGVHDRAWGERKIFGKIRYMSFQGCRNKFDVQAYIAAQEG
jgi:deoxyribodipyrimidine photo-lyase